MTKQFTEDEVRGHAKDLVFGNKKIKNAIYGMGQITSFNTLGLKLSEKPWKGVNDRPDGWYLPENPNDGAILFEFKSSKYDLNDKVETEVKKNMDIAKSRYKDTMGVIYNGLTTRVFIDKDNKYSEIFNQPDAIQDIDYYKQMFINDTLDVRRIYNLTKRINDNLHFNFGIRNLYDRMIFTASALVAKRYGAFLQKGMNYETMQQAIRSTLNKSLEDNINQNAKLNVLLDVFADIKMNITSNQEAINDFIACVTAISDQINSNNWRGEDVMGIFFNEFNRYKGKSDNGQVFTPEHITDFMYHLIDVNPNDSVFDGAAGSGAFLTKSMSNMIQSVGGMNTEKAKEIKAHQLYGIEIDREIFSLASANMMIHKDGKTNLTQLDTMSAEASEWMDKINYDENGNLKKHHITKILMNPPYERKYGCLKIVKNVFDNMPKGTDAAILLPDHKLEKDSKRLVKSILNQNRLLKIIKLPEETFSEGVSTSIFVFKLGEAQDDHKIFTYEIKNDGLETVKNQGRQDIKHRWPAIEKEALEVSEMFDTRRFDGQWITPDLKNMENLSYPVPEKPFEISEEDFMKTVMDYEMFKQGVDTKELQEKILNNVMYNSDTSEDNESISIKIKKSGEE